MREHRPMRAPAVVAQDQLASLQSADDFARYMRAHGVLDGEVRIAHGVASRTAWYPARRGIAHGVVSRTAWDRARRGEYRARRGMPHKVLTGMQGAGTAGRKYLPGVKCVFACRSRSSCPCATTSGRAESTTSSGSSWTRRHPAPSARRAPALPAACPRTATHPPLDLTQSTVSTR
jgi:hypothetical protein